MTDLNTTFKLVASKSLVTTLRKAVKIKFDCTVSAIFHGVFSSDVSFCKGMRRADAADFDTVLRVLIPITWDKKHEAYKFNRKMIASTASKLGYSKVEFEELVRLYRDNKEERAGIIQSFYERCVDYYNKYEEDKKEKDLNADLGMKALAKVISGVKSALQNGVDVSTLVSKIVEAGVSTQDINNAINPLSVKQELKA